MTSVRRIGILFLFASLLLTASSAVLSQHDDSTRDAWQRPAEVMDLIGVGAGMSVADVGCGEGYFVVHLARRVGEQGIVFAEDVDAGALEKARRRAEEAHLSNVRIVHGTAQDPSLPTGALDAVLIVNAYHEMHEEDGMLRAIFKALRPGGRLAIIDAIGEEGKQRAENQRKHTIPESWVREDAARNGFRFRSKEKGFDRPENDRRYWFFLIFEKPPALNPDEHSPGLSKWQSRQIQVPA